MQIVMDEYSTVPELACARNQSCPVSAGDTLQRTPRPEVG